MTDLAGTLTIEVDGDVSFGASGPAELWPVPARIEVGGGVDFPAKGVERRTVAVDMAGNPIGEIPDAAHGDITWGLNDHDDWSFTLPSDHPQAQLVHDGRFREWQLWRGDRVLAWGPQVRPVQQTGGRLAVGGKGASWYLGRRHIGKADRTNWVPNPSFEQGTQGWQAHFSPMEREIGRDPAYFEAATSTARAVAGRRSVRLALPEDWVPEFVPWFSTQFTRTVPASARDGDEWTAAIYCYIPSAELRDLGEAGLSVARHDPTDLVEIFDGDGVFRGWFPRLIEEASVKIRDTHPTDAWFRLEATLTQPLTGNPEIVGIYVYPPRGTMYIDWASLTMNERLEYFSTDQAQIAAGVVAHLQDPAYGKSNLRIDTNCPPTGVRRDATFLHSEHPPGWRTLDEFTRMSEGFDHRVVYTPTTRTYRTSFPQAGRWRPSRPFDLGGTVTSYSWAFDGEAAASAVVVLGQGEGSDRDEGWAVSPATYVDGLTLEEVFAAPPEAPVTGLDEIAVEQLRTVIEPQVLEVATVSVIDRPELLDLIPGDVVPVTIVDGALSIVGERYRIARITLTPTDRLKVTLNRVAT